MTRHLLLIKHAAAKIDPLIPRTEWPLTDVGRKMCFPLADVLARYAPFTLISSPEPKAQETAKRISDRLDISFEIRDGLHENDRTGMMITPSPVFRRRMATFFKDHDQRVLGHESAQEALTRFSAAISNLTTNFSQGNLAVVTHGAVLSLFVAAHNSLDPFPYWQHLGDPSFVVLSLPDYKILKTVKRITESASNVDETIVEKTTILQKNN